HPPTISTIADQTIGEDSSTAALSFVVTDIETPASNLVVTARSSNQTLLPDSAIVLAGATSNRTVTLRPATNQFGSATITLTVTDGGGSSASTSFLLTVNSVNDPPTIDPIADQTTTEDTSRTVAIRIGDLETAAPALILQALSTNTALVPPGNIS